MITHDLLEWKGIHLSPVRMNVMMNVAARRYLDSPEVRAGTNYPHRGSEDGALCWNWLQGGSTTTKETHLSNKELRKEPN